MKKEKSFLRTMLGEKDVLGDVVTLDINGVKNIMMLDDVVNILDEHGVTSDEGFITLVKQLDFYNLNIKERLISFTENYIENLNDIRERSNPK